MVSLGSSLFDYLGTVTFYGFRRPGDLDHRGITLDGGTLGGTDSFVADGALKLDPYSSLTTSGVVDAYGGLTIDAYSTLSGRR